ncbi:hypothetical protein Hanom_Chr00s003922g01716721 [Helianthus anomalus]
MELHDGGGGCGRWRRAPAVKERHVVVVVPFRRQWWFGVGVLFGYKLHVESTGQSLGQTVNFGQREST